MMYALQVLCGAKSSDGVPEYFLIHHKHVQVLVMLRSGSGKTIHLKSIA
jgi:hypothetical protein